MSPHRTRSLHFDMSHSISLLLTLVVIMSSNQGCSQPETPAGNDTRPAVASGAWFDSVRWEHRLLIFNGEDENATRQKALALDSQTGYLERNLLVIHLEEDTATVVVGETAAIPESELFRKRFAMPDDAFEVVLVGKDGGVKERRKAVFETEELFGIIDAMPMRMREMRR